MKYDFVVLGGTGMQGKIASKDLLQNGYSVMICGRDPSRIHDLLKHRKADFAFVNMEDTGSITAVIKKSGASVVVNCSELVFNLNAMKACLEAEAHYLDLGGLHSMTLQQFKLHHSFLRKNLIAITGCGSAPGITNVMAAYASDFFDTIQDINLGFAWNSNIKKFYPPYSIRSIIDEFTQRPVVLHGGKLVTQPRYSCYSEYDHHLIGRQKAWCVVHSEVFTFWKYFRDQGLRNVHFMAGFPDHSLNVIFTLMDLGFASFHPIKVQGVPIVPADFLAQVMKRIKMPLGYKEKETLWLEVIGEKHGKKKKIEIDCIVQSLPGWEFAGSNVNTGMTISIMAQMVKKGFIVEEGVTAPEKSIPPLPFFKELDRRGFHIYLNRKHIV